MRILLIDEQLESTRIVARTLLESGHSVVTAPNGARGMEMMQILWPSNFDVIAVALAAPHSWELIESAILFGFASHCIAMVDDCSDLDKQELRFLRVPAIAKPITASKIIHALDIRYSVSESFSMHASA